VNVGVIIKPFSMKKSFKHRVGKAIEKLFDYEDLGLEPCKKRRLYSLVWKNHGYRWVTLLDADGLLIGKRRALPGEGAQPSSPVNLTIGLIIQVEESTALAKANVLGKAGLEQIIHGIWVDTDNGGRKRLDVFLILFVLPEPTSVAKKKKWTLMKKNLSNVVLQFDRCEVLHVKQGATIEVLRVRFRKQVKAWIKSSASKDEKNNS